MSRVLWFHPRPVLPAHGGGQVRTLGLITCAVQAGHEVMLVQPTGAPGSARPDGVQLVEVALRRGASGIAAKVVSRLPLRSPRATALAMRRARREVERFQPDVSIVSDVLAWSITSSLLPRKPWVYDAHNVETDLYRSFRDDAVGFLDRLTFGIDYRRIATSERQVTAAAAALVTVSEQDAVRLTALAPVTRSVVVPSSVPTPSVVSRPGDAGPVVLFVGSLDYPPNVAALDELLAEVMPTVRESVREARLVVVGRRAARRLRDQLFATSWSELREDVPDLAPCYHEARCVILPIRSGSGSRLKVYEALSYGLPVVATSLAVAGVPLTPGADVVIATDPEDLAREAATVLTHNDTARRVGTAARETFLGRLSWSQVSEPLTSLLDELATSA